MKIWDILLFICVLILLLGYSYTFQREIKELKEHDNILIGIISQQQYQIDVLTDRIMQ